MKNLLITSAVLAMLATPSLAVELGKGFALDSTLSTHYSVEVEEFASFYEADLNYAVNTDLTVYVNSTVELQDFTSVGTTLGLEYVPSSFDKLTLTVEGVYDTDLEYVDTVISAELSF